MIKRIISKIRNKIIVSSPPLITTAFAFIPASFKMDIMKFESALQSPYLLVATYEAS